MANSGWQPILKKDGQEFSVLIVHWWPWRKFKDDSSLPQVVKDTFRKAIKYGSVYATCACVETPEGVLCGRSICMAIDKPRRKYGLQRALGLLEQKARAYGYTLEKVAQ